MTVSRHTDKSELRLDVAELLGEPGSRRVVRCEAEIPGLAAGLVAVSAGQPVEVDVVLESIAAGIVVHGQAAVSWRADCARCLERFDGRTEVAVDELYERSPVEGETYPLEGDEIDLEQMLRDVLVVEFPLSPSPGLDAEQRCTLCGRTPEELSYRTSRDDRDPRWDALRSLDL